MLPDHRWGKYVVTASSEEESHQKQKTVLKAKETCEKKEIKKNLSSDTSDTCRIIFSWHRIASVN